MEINEKRHNGMGKIMGETSENKNTQTPVSQLAIIIPQMVVSNIYILI